MTTVAQLLRRLNDLEGGASGQLNDLVCFWGDMDLARGDSYTVMHVSGYDTDKKYLGQENMSGEQFAEYIARPNATPFKITLEIIDDIPKSIKKVENNVIIYEAGTGLENKNIEYKGDQTLFLLPDNGRDPKP